MRVFFTNLGCKLNQAELEHLAREFVAAGHAVVGSLWEADLHVVNTCTVTHVAARTSRKVARRSRRHSPRVRTVLTGCYVTESPERAARLAGVDLVVDNRAKHELVARVQERFPEASGTEPRSALPYGPLAWGNSRGSVKIEDGCNVGCAFCIIPRTRGRQVSRPPDQVLAEVAGLARAGYAEVVLTGVQISHYRWQRISLFELVTRILEETELPRLRLTSIAPWRFDRRLFGLFQGGRLCRHVHLSLQSGCTGTLRRMKRPYTADAYRQLVEQVRREVPGVAITTDLIVGFPGETDQEFEASLDLVRRLGFARVHAFPYSPRPGTDAAAMPDQVDQRVKRDRMNRVLEAAATGRRAFWRAHLGSVVEVLWERSHEGRWRGTTDHYIPVVADGEDELGGRLALARLDRAGDDRVEATLLAEKGGSRESARAG